MVLLAISFLGGVLTILSPCVLPLLPVIIGGSLTEYSRVRPLIITAALSVSIIVFTLLLKFSTALISVPPRTWSLVSGGLVLGLGIVTLFPHVWEKLAARLNLSNRSNQILQQSAQKHNWVGAVLIGLSLGPVFSSCSPTYALILATVLPQDFATGLANLIAYALGLALVLLLIAVFGQRLIARLKWAANPTGWFKRGLGVLFILVGVLIIIGVDKRIETALVERGFGITALEERLVNDVDTDETNSTPKNDTSDLDRVNQFNVPTPIPAPELTGISDWINSEPLQLADLRGKVVLIDFWTYSCINCLRTLPYLRDWDQKYRDDGLVIIGVHAPEFAFEHELANVQQAVTDNQLQYPVALDNDFATWRAYSNRYWPAKYFIDRDGRIRHYHFGEGEYQESEEVIRALLAEGGNMPADQLAEVDDTATITTKQTPETYLGYERANNFTNSKERVKDAEHNYTLQSIGSDEWTLGGNWTVNDEDIIAGANAVLQLRVNAAGVYLVMGSSTPTAVQVRLNDAALTADQAGTDLLAETVTVSDSRLYRLIQSPTQLRDAVVELQVPAGVRLNAFTFGS